MAELSDAKKGQRAMWTGGEYSVVAEHIAGVGEEAAEAVRIAEGDRVLDVACGNGNATIPAAKAGATAIGLDLTPKLLEQGRERAAAEGLDIEWIEGDAEDLPFEDDSFDAVISVFGSMFAPDHRKAASELVRVLKPGGRLAVAAWSPAGAVGEMFATTSRHMPPPPEGMEPPILWGDPDHVAEIFEGTGFTPETEIRSVRFQFESLDAAMREGEESLPPMVASKAALEPQGKWEALRDELRDMYASLDVSDGESLVYDAEYLMTTGTKAP